MPVGIWVLNVQVGVVLASTIVFKHPLGTKGVPKAVRWNRPLALGPVVLHGFQMPKVAALGSSLKLPERMAAVGTVKIEVPVK